MRLVLSSFKNGVAEFVRIQISLKAMVKADTSRCLTTSATSIYPVYNLDEALERKLKSLYL
jgi:hypothetical protein